MAHPQPTGNSHTGYRIRNSLPYPNAAAGSSNDCERSSFRPYLRKGGGTCFARVCLSICLSVNKITQKRVHGFGCVSTDVGTWTNWSSFEPDPDHSPDAGSGLLYPIGLSYRLRNFAVLSRLPATCAATRNFTSEKSHVYVLPRASRGFKMVLLPRDAYA